MYVPRGSIVMALGSLPVAVVLTGNGAMAPPPWTL
jgi:hypothetical protein